MNRTFFILLFLLSGHMLRGQGNATPMSLKDCLEYATQESTAVRKAALEAQQTDLRQYPLNAITQRPMAMYHSWDSQNAWLRQIHAHNYLYVNTRTAEAAGIADEQWMWVESMHGKVRCMCRFSEAVEPGTVWTWNAIGKSAGSWGLTPDANEASKGFLLNHVISEELPPCEDGEHLSNSDPITGQAAWYDLKVRISPARRSATGVVPAWRPRKSKAG